MTTEANSPTSYINYSCGASLSSSSVFPTPRSEVALSRCRTGKMPPPHSWRPPKRPPRDHARHREGDRPDPTRAQDIPSNAFVQAYEAQLVYGHSAFARDLYALPNTGSSSAGTSTGTRGALMRWEGDDGDGDEERGEIWVDR